MVARRKNLILRSPPPRPTYGRPADRLRGRLEGRGEPIKIGFGMGLTGGLAASGKAAVLGMKIWEEETNAKGGLLGRPVKLIYYDDQSNPATVPGIFTKLIDVDKIDIAMGDYGTNLL